MRGEEGDRGALGPTIRVFLTLAGVSAAITLLFLGMRSVMEIGGTCASGQTPYVISHPCPKGVALVMFGGIWGGLILAGLYAWQAFKSGAPSLVGLLWPALFISLGWNFLEFGINPPGEGGLAWGWLVCAVLFLLMGATPLPVVLPALWRGPKETEASPAWHRGLFPHTSVLTAASALSMLRRTAAATARAVSTQGSTPASPDVVSMLERLDALHRSGALSDEEYERAKREVLGSGGSS